MLSFLAITLLTCLLFYLGTGRERRFLIGWTVWIGLVGVLAYNGFFLKTAALPPRMLFVLLPATAFVVYIYRTTDVHRLKLPYLLGVHVMRIGVELTLYRLYKQGLVPVSMTFAGWNVDILSGVSALLLLLYTLITRNALPDAVARIWNWLGLVLLTIIVVTAVLSVPSPVQQLAFDKPNRAILLFPYTLLPAVIVPTVLLAHLLWLKRLRNLRRLGNLIHVN